MIHINIFFSLSLILCRRPNMHILIVLDPNTKASFSFSDATQLCALVIHSEYIRNTVLSKLSTFQTGRNFI